MCERETGVKVSALIIKCRSPVNCIFYNSNCKQMFVTIITKVITLCLMHVLCHNGDDYINLGTNPIFKNAYSVRREEGLRMSTCLVRIDKCLQFAMIP